MHRWSVASRLLSRSVALCTAAHRQWTISGAGFALGSTARSHLAPRGLQRLATLARAIAIDSAREASPQPPSSHFTATAPLGSAIGSDIDHALQPASSVLTSAAPSVVVPSSVAPLDLAFHLNAICRCDNFRDLLFEHHKTISKFAYRRAIPGFVQHTLSTASLTLKAQLVEFAEAMRAQSQLKATAHTDDHGTDSSDTMMRGGSGVTREREMCAVVIPLFADYFHESYLPALNRELKLDTSGLDKISAPSAEGRRARRTATVKDPVKAVLNARLQEQGHDPATAAILALGDLTVPHLWCVS